MTDTYSVVPGRGDAPGLPPLNLPSMDTGAPRAPLRINVGAKPPKVSSNPYEGFKPYEAEPSAGKSEAGDPYAGFKPYSIEEKEPQRTVGTGEAAFKGALHGFSQGFTPALEGLAEVAGPQSEAFDKAGYGDPTRPIVGGFKMLRNALTSQPDPKVKEAYERGRQRALKDEQAASEQHPYAFFGGQMAGGMAMPIGGAGMQAATLAGRLGRGAAAGGIGGGLYGTGVATSEGKTLPEVAKAGAIGGAIGAPLGGAIGGAIGPRLVDPASRGQRAAETAENLLGVPLGRGLASDNRGLKEVTAKMGAVPLVGTRIRSNVADVETAAGEHLGGIAEQMAGGPPSRSVADALVRPGFQQVIAANRATIDAGYNALRGQINTTQHYTLPRTDAVLNRIMADRHAAGWANPAQGLEQFRNVANGATFNGAHRARVDAREAGNAVSPHPGYNAADFNQITRAMTEDLRGMVQAAATNQTPAGRRAALAAFDHAERQFGPLSEQNALLHRLANAQGEGAISKVLGSAKERGGNLRLLAQLRNSMPPAEFQQIGATLLHELGYRPSLPEHFSLSQFTTGWNKISDGAGRVLFSPTHRDHIDQIVNLGGQIKGSLRESNTSRTAHVLIWFDLARDAILLGAAAAAGTLTVGAGVGAVGGGAGILFGRWLASPATSASMAAWTRAYRGVASGAVSASRIAAFNAATRNLSHNLGIPADRILRSVQSRIASPQAEPDQPQ